MDYVIQCNKVKKSFIKGFKKKYVLSDLSLHIEENKIYGLLGRNGAGKTTLLNVITTRILKNSGEIKIFGQEPFENEKVLSKICFMQDTLFSMDAFTVKKILSLSSGFYDNWDESFKDELVTKFEIDINKKYRELSKGMKAIIGIIIGMASRAPITIFDEVYSGLDAASRELFYNLLLEDYIENPRTIIFSTHLIDEIAHIIQEVIIMDKGQIVLQENIDLLRSNSLQIAGDESVVDDFIKNINILKVENIGKQKIAYIYDEISQKKITELKENGVKIKPMTLQDLFIKFTIHE